MFNIHKVEVDFDSQTKERNNLDLWGPTSDLCWMDAFICELHFYFSPTLYNRHPHRFDEPPLSPSALCSVSTATPFHSVSALAPSPECAVSDQAVCGCLSVTHQLSALEGGQSREEDGKPWLLLDGHLAGAHIY